RLLERESAFSLVAEAESGRDGYAAYFRCLPDIVVMELSLPDIDGLEISRRILNEDPQARILAFDAQDTELLVSRAKEIGIKGFVNKRSSAQRIGEALRVVSSGGSYFSDVEASTSKSRQFLGWGLDLLTPREFEIFRRLAEGHSVHSIAELLDSCTKTVGVHQTRIMKKLGTSNAAQLAHLALSAGVIKLQPVPVLSQLKKGGREKGAISSEDGKKSRVSRAFDAGGDGEGVHAPGFSPSRGRQNGAARVAVIQEGHTPAIDVTLGPGKGRHFTM
ncbi:MAG: regulatory protein LuxR, partial [Proteobacteria bacterium]|nr:regulatory protein LuxR [Pseudomonadota bacterium]